MEQDWSAEQKEVWEMELAYWEFFKAGDLKEHMKLWHKDVIAWPHWSPKPLGKETLEIEVKPWLKPLSYDLKPLTINIFGNIAVIYYRVHTVRAGNQYSSARIVHLWMKQDGKWEIIGGSSCGSSTKEE